MASSFDPKSAKLAADVKWGGGKKLDMPISIGPEKTLDLGYGMKRFVRRRYQDTFAFDRHST